MGAVTGVFLLPLGSPGLLESGLLVCCGCPPSAGVSEGPALAWAP